MEECLERTGSHRVANCKEGGKGIKVVKGNTSNLMSHLKTKHSKVYEEVRRKTDEKRKSKQSSSQSSALKTHVQQSLPGMAAKKPSWIAIVPFTRKSQEELLYSCDFSWSTCTYTSKTQKTTFSRSIVPSMYKEARKEVESKLSDVLQSKNKMSLTSDMWTSEANDAYLGLTWRHTGVNIASCQILRDFTIDQAAVSAVITDNASNMDLASRLGEWNSRHCFGHTLQLAIDDGIKMSPGIREMIKSTKAIVAFYNRSTKGTERLTELQVQLSLPKHKLLSDCPTRWNSTYYMLTQLLEQKPAITVLCASSVSAAEWCMMSELIQILQPLEEATRELSAEQRVCCSNVIPLLNALLFELRRNVVDDDETQVPDDDESQVPESQGSSVPTSEESQQVVVGLIASIERRWLNYEEDRIYSICTLLDPRFKEVCFTNAALVRAKRLLLSIMRALTQGDSVTSSASVVNDDQEDVPIKKKKCILYGTVLMNSKRRNILIYQLIKTKTKKNCHYTGVLNTSTERRIL
ncbi:zinc finger BED domain-containing protein 4-like [Dysidea avara]|uniref:zinc finger BED domain-containing protein 4-like n=1 Tax=Dysidea avara TaxID=196820 RepID=UPI0033236A8D